MSDSARLAEMAEAIIRRLYETDALSGGDYNTLLNATRALWETEARIDYLIGVGDILHDIIAPATCASVATQLDIWNAAVQRAQETL